jgi:hypothetical protein
MYLFSARAQARVLNIALKGRNMAYSVRRVDYFYITVEDHPGEAYRLLSTLATMGVNLVAFTAVPLGAQRTQLTIFPDDSSSATDASKRAGIALTGPQPAFLVQGDDEMGTLSTVHQKLYEAKVNVSASSGVTDGKGSFGYIIYVRLADYEMAAKALGV